MVIGLHAELDAGIAMTHLDLFSGIGGFALAAKWRGFDTIAFCEKDEFCQKVLKKHWPNVPVFGDIKEFDGEQFNGKVDLLTGGFPCQDISRAGKQEGINGENSGLFFEMLRVIKESKPRYVLAENVGALRSNGLADVLAELAKIGYYAEWHSIPAHAVGSPQVRDRVWIVAYPMQSREAGRRPGWIGRRCSSQSKIGQNDRCGNEKKDVQFWAEPDVGRVANGIPNGVDRINSLGNSIVPQVAYALISALFIGV